MRSLAATILLFALCVPSRANDEIRCRTLFKHVVQEKRAMGTTGLAEYLSSPPGTNPIDFSSWPTPTAQHVYRRAFDELLRGDTRALIEKTLRTTARELLGSSGEHENNQRRSRDATRAVPLPELVRRLPTAMGDPGSPIYFVHEGRPHLALAVGDRSLGVIDLTDDRHHIIPLARGGAHPPPLHIQTPDHSFLAYAGSAAISTGGRDERGMGMVTLDGKVADALLPRGKILSSATGKIAPIMRGDELWLAVIDSSNDAVALVPVSQPGVKVDHRAVGQLAQFRSINAWYGKQETLLLVPGHTGFLVIDPATKAPTTITSSSNPREAQFYTLDQKPMVLMNGAQGLWGVDARTGQEEKIITGEINDKPVVFERNGRPLAIVDVRDQTNRSLYHRKLIDLGTKAVIRELGPAEDADTLRHFEYAGRDYAVWGTLQGEIAVLDLQAGGTPVRRKVVSGEVNSILPIPIENGVGAIVKTRPGDPPSLVRLLAPPK